MTDSAMDRLKVLPQYLVPQHILSRAMGLLVEAHSQRQRGRKIAHQTGSFSQTVKRMKEWIVGNF